MDIRGALNRRFSREASPEKKEEILGVMKKAYGTYASKASMTPAFRERCQNVLNMLDNAENVRVYPWKLTPPIGMGVMDCFGSTFDFRYREQTKTLEIGGSLSDLYFIANSE